MSVSSYSLPALPLIVERLAGVVDHLGVNRELFVAAGLAA